MAQALQQAQVRAFRNVSRFEHTAKFQNPQLQDPVQYHLVISFLRQKSKMIGISSKKLWPEGRWPLCSNEWEARRGEKLNPKGTRGTVAPVAGNSSLCSQSPGPALSRPRHLKRQSQQQAWAQHYSRGSTVLPTATAPPKLGAGPPAPGSTGQGA